MARKKTKKYTKKSQQAVKETTKLPTESVQVQESILQNSDEQNMSPPVSAEELDKNTIKLAIQKAIKKYILAHVPQGIISNDIEKGAVRDGTEKPDVIGTADLLEWQHVYGLIPSLIAERPHLRETVGIFPPFSNIRMNEFLQNEAELKVIQNLKLPTRVTQNGDVVLLEDTFPPDANLTEAERANKAQILAKRNQDALARRAQAQALLNKNNLGQGKAFLLYLESIGEAKEHFLGNPYKKDITLKDCTQLIIPFNFDNWHYTTTVVHLDSEQKIATIKYYDSVGADLPEFLKQQLITYITQLGFQPHYISRSSRDQHNADCAIFASFMSVDMANENVGNPERLLGNMKSNYNRTMTLYRYITTLKLKEFGQNVEASSALTSSFKHQQNNFVQQSVHSQKTSLLNGLIIDIKAQLERALALANNQSLPPAKAQVLPDLSPRVLFGDCSRLHVLAKTALKELQAKANLQEQEIATAKSLQVGIEIYEILNKDIEREIAQLENGEVHSYFSNIKKKMSWASSLNWVTLGLLFPLGCVGIFVGFPALVSFGLFFSQEFAMNPFIPIFVGTAIFSAGASVISVISSLLDSDEESPEPKKIRNMDVRQNPSPMLSPTKTALPTINPPVLNQFNLARQQNSGSVNSPIVIPEHNTSKKPEVVDLTAANNEEGNARPSACRQLHF